MTADASTSRIVRWEILRGLPGEGPTPQHFHVGHPTPWTEGYVVRFWNDDGTQWVGNFKRGTSGHTAIVHWPEANAVAVDAAGFLYLINAGDLDDYSTTGSGCYAARTAFNEDRTRLFIACGYSIQSYCTDRKLQWESNGLGGI